VLWNRNFVLRAVAPYVAALIAAAATLQAYSQSIVETFYLHTTSDSLLRQVRLAAELLPWGLDHVAMDQRCAAIAAKLGVRVTVVDSGGTVLGDSETASAILENHRDRVEVHDALRHGVGIDVRESTTIGRDLLYRAWRDERIVDGVREQRIVRVAVPRHEVTGAMNRIQAAIWWAFGLAGSAGMVALWWASKRASRRIGRLVAYSAAASREKEAPVIDRLADDEVGQLETHVVRMGEELGAQLRDARAEKTKLQAILAGMVEGVLVLDRNGTIVLSNQRADQLFGKPLQQGDPIINYSRDPDLQSLVREVTRSLNGQSLMEELTLKVGEREDTLQVTASPLPGNDQGQERFVLVFHDVTELKHLERVRRDFVANVSHEIRTPLTAVRGYAETLRNGAISDPERALKFLDVIERHSERLTRLTDDLLTLSDLELGRAAMRYGRASLVPAIDTAMDVVRAKAEKRGVRLQREVQAQLPQFVADQDRIVQVLVNLLDNAVKYTEAGGSVTISATTGPSLRANGNGSAREGIEIRVSDTGIGIPSKDLPRLTERFYRVDKARSRDLGGTGLGLAIVKHIVQAHEGLLKIESEVGRGTTVRVWLPNDRSLKEES
jgi:two-component system phosphate regulon sensor histidine kinase PhoR